MSLPITIISDCRDDNASSRVMTRLATLFPHAQQRFVGVHSDLEAAGCLVDALDAARDSKSLILVNVAPRADAARKRSNGSPFGYFQLGECSVFATLDGHTLSLVRKLWPSLTVTEYDLESSAHLFKLNESRVKHIIASQFRSYEYLPFLADLVCNQKVLPRGAVRQIGEFPDIPPLLWYIDCFGNAKTSYLGHELSAAPGKVLHLKIGGASILLKYYVSLKDMPNGEVALVVGSSGFGEQRFLEIIMRGGSAAAEYGLASGQHISLVR